MAKHIKLPESLRQWKVGELVSKENGVELYRVTRQGENGAINGYLRHICCFEDTYEEKNIGYLVDESAFLTTIKDLGDCFNYLEIEDSDDEHREKFDLYIVTEDLPALSELMKTKKFTEAEIVDFGIQMSAILEKLEAKGIYHGNVCPENIFIDKNGSYRLGGFSDFESKISDMSYVSPEIYSKQDADFTTDIYSLGLIMYSLLSDGKIPFEGNGVSRSEAIRKRLDEKASVSAPKNADEKLKSVIVIACQTDSANRWKNAGNIKNALLSIQGEQPKQDAESKAAVIPVEKTDFEENVFDEYVYEGEEEKTENQPEKAQEEPAVESENQENEEMPEAEEKADETENEPEEKSDDDEVKDESADSESDAEQPIDGDVFDEYEPTEKKSDFREQNNQKDYGSFFDDVVTVSEIKDEDVVKADNSDEEYYDVFSSKEAQEENENNAEKQEDKGKKKNAAVIAVCIVVMLAALGFVAYCIVSGLNSSNENNKETTTSPASTTEAATTAPETTQPETTEPTTKATGTVKVASVVGSKLDEATKTLEAQGLKAEATEYFYSDYYEKDCVIYQSIEAGASAEKGTTVYFAVSLGKQEAESTTAETKASTEATTKPAQQSSKSSSSAAKKTDSGYILSNSDSSYLSKSQVESLSRENLNLAVNEIYARRGRIFNDQSLADYFNSKSWYTPKYTAEEFSQNVTFNQYEQANLQLMVDVQKEKGYR